MNGFLLHSRKAWVNPCTGKGLGTCGVRLGPCGRADACDGKTCRGGGRFFRVRRFRRKEPDDALGWKRLDAFHSERDCLIMPTRCLFHARAHV